jgi:ABC-type lipoprotein release transport system permease subunit
VFWVLGRLRPGVSVGNARAALNAGRSDADAFAVQPYTGLAPEVAAGVSRVGAIVTAAAAAVFFIACSNVATFLLARASARSHETSVRVALGASRGQLARRLLCDSVVVAAAGGAIGLLLARWTAGLVPALFFLQDATELVFVPDVSGIAVAAATCVSIVVACGLLPFLEMRHDAPAAVLQRGGGGPSRAMRRLRAGLVAAQMTCCCLLVVATGLLLTGYRTAQQTRAGHLLEPVVLATLRSGGGALRPDLGLRYFREAAGAVRSISGVVPVAWVGTPPGARPVWQSFRVEPAQLPRAEVVMDVASFTPPMLTSLVMPPLAGRMFGIADTPQGCRVAIVNEAAARESFDGEAVGRSVDDPSGQRVEIVGVVAERKPPQVVEPNRPTIYYYAEQTAPPLDRTGPAVFRVSRSAAPMSAVLETNVVSPRYFDAMGLSVVAGRVFPERTAPGSCRAGVVDAEAAELYFGGNAVGGALIDGEGRRTAIVGVVHAPLLRTSQRRAGPALYLPMAQDFVPQMTLLLSAHDAGPETQVAVRRRLEGVTGAAGPPSVTTLDAQLARTALAFERIATVLVGASAATALALGVLGLFGAMAEAARQRRREFALRIALGAQRWRIVRQVLAEGARLAGTGLAAGMLGSILVARWVARITPGAEATSGWVWLAPPVLLAVAVIVASVLPAHRAAAVNPLMTLRNE